MFYTPTARRRGHKGRALASKCKNGTARHCLFVAVLRRQFAEGRVSLLTPKLRVTEGVTGKRAEEVAHILDRLQELVAPGSDVGNELQPALPNSTLPPLPV